MWLIDYSLPSSGSHERALMTDVTAPHTHGHRSCCCHCEHGCKERRSHSTLLTS